MNSSPEQLAKYQKLLAEASPEALAVLKERKELVGVATRTAAALTEYARPHRGEMGLVPDNIRLGIEYRRLDADYKMAHRQLRDFMRAHPRKLYGKYYDAESHLKIAKERNLL